MTSNLDRTIALFCQFGKTFIDRDGLHVSLHKRLGAINFDYIDENVY
jgi:hypothetical protein